MRIMKILLIAALACNFVTLSTTCMLACSPLTGGHSVKRGANQAKQDAPELVPGALIERDIKGGESHSYRVTLIASQYVRVSVTPLVGALMVFGPGNQQLAEAHIKDKPTERGRILLVSEAAGDYRVELRAREDYRYLIKISELRPATSEDRDRFAAQGLLAEANRASDDNALKEALRAWRSLGDREGEADTLFSLGIKYDSLGEFHKALDCFSQALPLTRAMQDYRAEAKILNDIGEMYHVSGELHTALEYYDRAIRARGVSKRGALSLNNSSVAYRDLGELQKALDYGHQALATWSDLGDKHGEGYALNNVGAIYSLAGEPQKALEYHSRALSIFRNSSDFVPRAISHAMIGGDYFSLGDPHKALEHYSKALELVRAISLRELEASLLGSIGSVYLSLSEYQKAEGFYNQALLLSRTITYPKREAFALRGMGEVYLSTGEPRKALECYAQALLLYRAMESRMEEAATLYGIARAKRELGDLTEARAQIEGALNIIESTRTKVMSQDLRSSFLASNQSYYELYIDVLMSLSQRHPAEGYAAAALLASERARARSLLEILMESRFDIRQGVDAALLQRERNLQQRINAKAERLTRLLGGKHTEQDVAEARKEIDSLLADYRQIQAQIRRRSPRYAALVQPQPLTLNEIQEQVLDDDSLLLEYSLGRDRSYLWAITSSQMKCYELPARDKIETAARRLYELLARGDRRELRTQLKIAAAELSRIVLNPVAAQLKGKRLLIVSDGTLQYIPFASLPEPQPSLADAKAAGNRQQGIEYGPALILQHEVLALPSASVLAILRQEFAGKSSASKAVAVLADPVLVSDDPRIKRPTIRAELHTSVNSQSSDISLIRSARESGVSFERLRYTRQEADTIVSLSKQGASLKAVDFDASKATAINPALGDYRIIHFATHGLINSRHPELSGLVLSLVDERGRPQDGFLRLHDVYNLKLAADLIVLSACQTALGKEVKGEGLIGLTRGFMYAGAARVVASLWDVKDEATAELMKRFYERVFRDRLKPSAALRAAQISMWKEERWRSPYYWAGFIFQGEWR